jgi:hypothetical protein
MHLDLQVGDEVLNVANVSMTPATVVASRLPLTEHWHSYYYNLILREWRRKRTH